MNGWIIGIVVGFVIQALSVYGYLVSTQLVEVKTDKQTIYRDIAAGQIFGISTTTEFDNSRYEIRRKKEKK